MAFETQADIAAKRASWSSNQAASERAPAPTSTTSPKIDPRKAAAAEQQAEVERAAGINTTTSAMLQAEQAKTAGTTKPAPAVITSNAATTRNETNQAELAATQDNIAESNANAVTTPTTTPPPTTSQNTQTGTSGTTTQNGTQTPAQPTVDPLQTQIDAATSTIDAEYNSTIGLLDARMASLDASTQAKIKSIQASYAVRREETKRLNQILLQGNTKAGIRAGRDRYAAEINQGILTDVEQQGLRRISELDAEEMELITAAQAANDENQFNLLASKMSQIHEKRKEKEAAISKLHSDAMAAEQAAFQRAKDMREMQKWDREDASASVDAMVASGMDPASVPPEYFAKLDAQMGVAPGVSAGMMQIGMKERQQLDAVQELEQAAALNTLLRQLPVGETITIGDTKYNSLNTGEIQTSTETNEQTGDAWMISYNQDTGELKKTFIGNFGNQAYQDITSNEGAVVRVFDDGSQKVLFNPLQPNGGVATGGLVAAFPEGSVTPFTRSTGGLDRASECGAWVNDVTGIGLGDTFQDKLAKMDAGISEDNVQIGDVGISQAGTSGHAFIVNGISMVDGEKYLTLSESNWVKQPGTDGKIGLITHTRQIKASDAAGFARPGFKNPEYNFGTDAPNALSGLTFGDPSASGSVSTTGRVKDRDYQTDAGKIYDDYNSNQSVKDFVIQQTGYQTALNIDNNTTSPQDDIALIFSFMKVLDPTSVVREGEFSTASKYTSLLDSIGVKWNKVQKGTLLSPTQRQGIKNAMESKYEIANQLYQNTYDTFANRAEQFNIDPADALVDYRQDTGTVPGTSTPANQSVEVAPNQSVEPTKSLEDWYSSVFK